MPDINMQVFEEAQRNQLVTEVDIQTQVALDDYQVQLSDVTNPTQSQDNVVIDRHGEFLPHWNESLDFDTWVKMSMEVAGKRLLVLRGNSNVGSASNGSNTFIQYHGVASSQFLDSLIVPYSNIVYEGKVRPTNATHSIRWGLKTVLDGSSGDEMSIDSYSTTNLRYSHTRNNGTQTVKSEAPSLSSGTWVQLKITNDGTTVHYYVDDNEIATGTTTNLPDVQTLGLVMYDAAAGVGEQDWSFVRKYTANEPVWIAEDTPQNISTALKLLGRAG